MWVGRDTYRTVSAEETLKRELGKHVGQSLTKDSPEGLA